MKIAILGAGGFLATRAIEYLLLTGEAEVRGIVRRYSSLTRLSRFQTDWRIADATDENQLTVAFEGCEVVLHCIMGDNAAIAHCATAGYRAAERAGVRLIILISTAAVYGSHPQPDSDESIPLGLDGLGDYAAAKLRSENEFRRLASHGKVRLVILRPSLITGPRSYWISHPAGQIYADAVHLADGGPGFCNTIYVDNLIAAVLLAARLERPRDEVFLVGDSGCGTWAETYAKLAELLGASLHIKSVPYALPRPPGMTDRLRSLRHAPALVGAALMTPSFIKNPLRRALGLTREIPLSWELPGESPIGALPADLAALHVCHWRLPSDKAHRVLGYTPVVSIDEGLRRSVEWLRYSGQTPET